MSKFLYAGAIINKHSRFINSNFYKIFSTIDVVEYDSDDLNHYDEILEGMKDYIGLIYPNITEIAKIDLYIDEQETIKETDRKAFHIFLKDMFLKIKSIIDDLNKYNTKKNYTTCIIDKQKIQAQEDKIKAKQDLYDFKLQARLDKLKEIENVKRFNNSIVQCDCGIFHKQSATAHHSISNLHNIGMTAINSYISRKQLTDEGNK